MSSSEIKETAPIDQPALWADDHAPANERTTPAHLDPAKCGTNWTNYTNGCRCPKCRDFRRTEKRLLVKGTRICKHCGVEYPRTTGGGTKFCKTCLGNGVYWRNSRGMKGEERHASTDGTCARCREPFRKKRSRAWDRRCVRGIICRDCNLAMPHRLDALRAQGIADYLAAHEHA